MIEVFIDSTFGNVDERSALVLSPNVFDVKADAKHKSSRVHRNGIFLDSSADCNSCRLNESYVEVGHKIRYNEVPGVGSGYLYGAVWWRETRNCFTPWKVPDRYNRNPSLEFDLSPLVSFFEV